MSIKILEARYGSPDRPLKIGDFEIQCYVLEDEKRVLVQKGMLAALGMSLSGGYEKGVHRLAQFTQQNRIKPYVDKDLRSRIETPIKFKIAGGAVGSGYNATILVDICNAIMDARKAGVLTARQLHFADRAEMLVRAFAKTGIIALVDEATGYQKLRDRDALQRFFEKALQEEQAAWIKTFQDDFFEMIFRMRGWTWHYASTKKPGVVGRYINDIVYDRIAPDLAKELKQLAKDKKTGKRKGKLFQHLTPEYGHPKLTEHLSAVTALGRASGYNWTNFKRLLERAFPKFGSNLKLEFGEDED